MSDSGFWHGSTNENSRDKMKKILSMAVLNELTERQRICIVDYYLNGKKEKEIAKELGVNSSTVSRHIMKARDGYGFLPGVHAKRVCTGRKTG